MRRKFLLLVHLNIFDKFDIVEREVALTAANFTFPTAANVHFGDTYQFTLFES